MFAENKLEEGEGVDFWSHVLVKLLLVGWRFLTTVVFLVQSFFGWKASWGDRSGGTNDWFELNGGDIRFPNFGLEGNNEALPWGNDWSGL